MEEEEQNNENKRHPADVCLHVPVWVGARVCVCVLHAQGELAQPASHYHAVLLM